MYSLELSAMRRCLDAAQRSAIAQAAIAALSAAPATAKGAAVMPLLSGMLALVVAAIIVMTAAVLTGLYTHLLLS